MTPEGLLIIDLFYRSLESKRLKTNKRVITERDASILKRCYDFEECLFPILEDVAKDYERTKERIRQIHEKSLKKINAVGRKFGSDTSCGQLIEHLSNSIESSEGANIYLKVINCWEINLPEYPRMNVVRLFSHLYFTKKGDIARAIKELKKYNNLEIAEKKSLARKEYIEKKAKDNLSNQQNSILNEVIWFSKKTKWNNVKSSDLKPKRQIVENEDYNSGVFESHKCGRSIQYESGLELDFIMQLESFPAVKFYVEQPTRIEYERSGKKHIYTPDFAVFLENNEAFLVEIKDFTGMVDARVHRNIEALIDYCELHGFGLLFTDGKNSINKLLTINYNIEFEKELKLKLEENGGRTIFFEEFKSLQSKFNVKQMEFLSIVLKNNWSLYPFHFKLSNRNNYHKFRTIILKNYPQQVV